MEVPGIAPGSARPSPSVSTCVFEDRVSPAAGLLDGPPPTSCFGFRPLVRSACSLRREPARLIDVHRAASGGPLGERTAWLRSQSQVVVGSCVLSRCFARFRETSARYLRIRKRVESDSPPNCQATANLHTRGPPEAALSCSFTLIRASGSVNPASLTRGGSSAGL